MALTAESQGRFAGWLVAIRCPRPSLQPQNYPAFEGGSMRWRWTWSGTGAGEASAAGTRWRARVRSAERTRSNQMASRVPPTRGPRCGGPGRARRGRRVPRMHASVPPALGAAARLMAAGRVDVHAADDVPGAGAEHGVGEPAALGEVLCVPLQVAETVTQGHLARPAAIREPRHRPDVVNAGRPGGVIGLVVLRPERGQPEFPGYEPGLGPCPSISQVPAALGRRCDAVCRAGLLAVAGIHLAGDRGPSRLAGAAGAVHGEDLPLTGNVFEALLAMGSQVDG